MALSFFFLLQLIPAAPRHPGPPPLPSGHHQSLSSGDSHWPPISLSLPTTGFCRTYTDWTYHNESLISRVQVADDAASRNNMAVALEDHMEEDTNLDDSSGVYDDFEELLKEVQSELYPGCTKFSSLDFLSKLMNIKVNNKWTNSSFDVLLEYFCSPKHKKQSAANKQNRKKQKYTNRGGTASFSSATYKKNQSRLDTFIKAHTRRDGTIDPAASDDIRSI